MALFGAETAHPARRRWINSACLYQTKDDLSSLELGTKCSTSEPVKQKYRSSASCTPARKTTTVAPRDRR
eukprot:1003973-Rhodomonas_salina.1